MAYNKILHITSMYPTSISGVHSGGHAVYHLVESVEKLIGIGQQDVLFFHPFLAQYYWLFSQSKRDTRDFLQPAWKEYLSFRKTADLPWGIFGGMPNYLWQTFSPAVAADNRSYSLVHIHTAASLGIYGLRLAKALNVPAVITPRAETTVFYKQDCFLRSGLERSIRTADAVVAPSVVIANAVRDIFAREAVVIPNGTGEVFDSHTAEPQVREKHSILFAGVLEQRKGLLPLLETFVKIKIKFPTAKLYIAGMGPLERTVLKYSRLASSITFLGQLSQEALCSWMDKCEILCVPSYTETFGIIYAEAMKRGMAVVARKGTGIAGMGVDQLDYVLIENDDQLLGALVEMLGDSQKIGDISAHGRELAKAWSWENTARRYLDIYGKISQHRYQSI